MAPRVAICSAMMANVVTWLLLGKTAPIKRRTF